MTSKAFRMIARAVVVAAALSMVPTAGDAASWWPWGKKKDNPPAEEIAPVLDPAPPAAVGPDGTVVFEPAPEQPDRIARLEARIRDLTGQVETLSYQVRQLQQQVQASTGGASRKLAAAPKEPEPQPQESAVLVVPDAPPPDAVGTVIENAPAEEAAAPGPEPLGTLTLDAPEAVAADQPLDLTAAARGTVEPATADPVAAKAGVRVVGPETAETQIMASLGDPRADYERGYNNILAGDYDVAEASFRQFLTSYPSDELAPDAQYWIGESLFARGEYRLAANEFLNGHKAYPKSGKGADTLLKLGLSLAGLGERDAACSTYAQVVKQYPQASNALRQRVAAEQASASC